jgi:hypothetical protein
MSVLHLVFHKCDYRLVLLEGMPILLVGDRLLAANERATSPTTDQEYQVVTVIDLIQASTMGMLVKADAEAGSV